MKKQYGVWLLCLVVLVATAAYAVDGPVLGDITTTSASLSAPLRIPGAPEFAPGDLGVEAVLEGFTAAGAPGDPVLPQHVLCFLMPEGVSWDSIEVRLDHAEWEPLPGRYDLAPAGAEVVNIDGRTMVSWGDKDPGRIVDGRDMDVYGRDADFPPLPVVISESAAYRSWNVLFVTVNPLAYNPVQQTLRLLRSGTLHIAFGVEKVEDRRTPAAIDRFWNQLALDVANPESRELFYPDDDKGLHKNAEADYVIITTQHIRDTHIDALNTFTAHKATLDFKPRIVVEGAAMTPFTYVSGAGAQARSLNIRAWLQEHYLSLGIVSVMLIGDQHPSRFTASRSIPMLMIYPAGLPDDGLYGTGTDMHFAELSGNWDRNGNGVYGEWGTGSAGDFGAGGIDRISEVNVGRIPYFGGIWEQELERILGKIVDYETAGTDQSWRRRLLVASAVSNLLNEDNEGAGPNNEWPNGIADITIPQLGAPWGEAVKSMGAAAGLQPFTLYEKEGPGPHPVHGPNAYANRAYPTTTCDAPLTQNNFVNEWKAGYGYTLWFAHGNSSSSARVVWRWDDFECENLSPQPDPMYPECYHFSAYDRIAQGREGRHGRNESRFVTFIHMNNAAALDNTRPAFVLGAACLLAEATRSDTITTRLLRQGAVGLIMPSGYSRYVLATTYNGGAWRDRAVNAQFGYDLVNLTANDNMSIGQALSWMRQNFGTLWGAGSWSNIATFNVWGDPAGSPRIYNNAPPRVERITRLEPSPTAAETVAFHVRFSKEVVGLTVNNLALTVNGLENVAIESLEGSIQDYVVTVNTGTGVTGTIRLDLGSTANVVCWENLPLQGTHIGDESYTIDREPPVIHLNGPMEMLADCATWFDEPGAYAVDNIDGHIGWDRIVVGGDLVDISTVGSYAITYDVSDAAGNAAATMTRIVYVIDYTPPEILFCAVDRTVAATGSCMAVVPDFTVDVIAEDTCSPWSVIQYPAPGMRVTGVGEHTVGLYVTDGENNQTYCEATLFVEDRRAPLFTQAPENRVISLDEHCEAVMPDFTVDAVGQDNCSDTLVFSQIPAPGTPVGAGLHEVVITVTDESANAFSVERTLLVVDASPPLITDYPANLVLAADEHCEAVVPDFRADLLAVDNCTAAGDLAITQFPEPGYTVGIGSHQVALEVTDGAGNRQLHTVNLGVSGLCEAIVTATDERGGPLDTVSPRVAAAAALDERSVSVSFSKPVLESTACILDYYRLSGLGMGTLSETPHGVTPESCYTLRWDAPAEMRDGVSLNLSVNSLQDTLGNPIHEDFSSIDLTGIGIPPVFSNLKVEPSRAYPGQTVTIRFDASEPLMIDDPVLMVNGREALPAAAGKSEGFAFVYEVDETDDVGMATIMISGADLAGNIGTLSNNDALEILEPFAEVPMSPWPAALVLGAAGVLALALRRRATATALLLTVALLAAGPAAVADTATATVISVVQRPDEVSTRVDIQYNLYAPNGACDITVWLSKDGGEDGYIYPVTAITGNIGGVETGENHLIVWDIRAEYPELYLPDAHVRLVAVDEIGKYSLSYQAGPHGAIEGDSPQHVKAGADGADVAAIPHENAYFVQWSDGRTDAERRDMNVEQSLSVTAQFALHHYSLAYAAGRHGSISGISPQTVPHGGIGMRVRTIPDFGYAFEGWSDGVMDDARTDLNITADLAVTAIFAANQYTLLYTAGSGGQIDGEATQTVNHGADGTAIHALPEPGHHFVQWSDGSRDNPRVDHYVTENLEAAAEFAINTYVLTYHAGPGGSIVGDAVQTVEHGADGAPVEALSASGYYFVAWSDDRTDNPRTDTAITADTHVTALFSNVSPVVTAFDVNTGDDSTIYREVTLNNQAVDNPEEYMASEFSDFRDANWMPYAEAPVFALSPGYGVKTLYFKVRNVAGESEVVDDAIERVSSAQAVDMVPVPAGAFEMGRPYSGGDVDETPVHTVTLAAYEIGKYEITNQQYSDVLNWARAQGYLYTSTGAAWSGAGRIFAGAPGARYMIVNFDQATCNIEYVDGLFMPKSKTGENDVLYSLADHPMVQVSWYGAVAFSNWLSLMEGLTACYDMTSAHWPLVLAPPSAGGYRLPTEAEWERAAAWDAATGTHWRYGFAGETLDYSYANYSQSNPLGLVNAPFTSPAGWFNGVNITPNGNVPTQNSVSPVGAYDMTGNVWDWCHDWYQANYYGEGSKTNPAGPTTGTNRTGRGGSLQHSTASLVRAARRAKGCAPGDTYAHAGFRIAQTP